MKKINANGKLLKHIIFIFIYLRLFIYLLSYIISTIISYRSMLLNMYERRYFTYEYTMIIAIVMGLLIGYAIIFVAYMFFSYIKLFLLSINKDIWVIKITSLEISEVNIDDEKSSNEDLKEKFGNMTIDERLERYFSRNIKGLLILIAISVLISVFTFIIN